MRSLAVAVVHLLLWVEMMEPLVLENSYPNSSNYSIVTLTCYEEEDKVDFVESAVFRLNETRDVKSEMKVEKTGEGNMTFVLTQEKEGMFQCEKNGTNNTSNTMFLAAQPHNVDTVSEVPIATNATYIVTDLPCGIQPGALAQKYTVSWTNNSLNLSLSDSAFILSLNLTVKKALNSVYQCNVTVDHDGVHSKTYCGGSFKFTQANGSKNANRSSKKWMAAIIAIFSIILFTILVLVLASTRWRYKRSKSKALHSCTLSNSDEERFRHVTNLHEDRRNEPLNVSEMVPVPGVSADDNDQDPDLVRAVSSCRVSDDTSFSPSTCIIDEDMACSSPSRFIFTTNTQDQSHDKLIGTPVFDSNDLPISKYFAKELERSVEGCEEVSECINPHCPCHGLRMRKLMHISSSAETTEGVCVDSGSRLPEWMYKLHTLIDCTEKGVVYKQHDYGFILEIPEGAIPHGQKLMIEIGISLYGPFLYPKGDRRVSPIVWVCVRDQENFRFLKPVRLTLQHCLDVGDMVDSESLGLRFLKASHSQNSEGFHTFESTEGTVSTSSDPNYLILSTNHFCYLCITSNTLPDTLERIQYCLSPYYPQPVLYNENDELHFYVSFFLQACLTTIHKQCGEKCRKMHRQRFSFTADSRLTISFSDPERWLLTLQCNDEISAGDVDFFHKDHVQLLMEEEEGMYPPKFTVGLLSREAAESTKARFDFHGATKKISMDIPLHLERPAERRPSVLPIPTGNSENTPPTPYQPEPWRGSTPVTPYQPPKAEPWRGSTPTIPCRIPKIEPWSRNTPVTPYQPPKNEPWRGSTPVTPYRYHRIPKVSVPLNAFMEQVATHVRTKWRFFGIMIDIPPDILDTFPLDNALHCFERVFDYWSRRGSPPLTWEAIVEVLESDTVDEKKVADEVRKAFLPPLQTAPQGIDHSTSNESQYSQQTKSSDTGYASNQSAGIHTPAEYINIAQTDVGGTNDISRFNCQADIYVPTTASYAANDASISSRRSPTPADSIDQNCTSKSSAIVESVDVGCATVTNDISRLHLQADKNIVSGSTTAPYAASNATTASHRSPTPADSIDLTCTRRSIATVDSTGITVPSTRRSITPADIVMVTDV